jgi:hypothetical protein
LLEHPRLTSGASAARDAVQGLGDGAQGAALDGAACPPCRRSNAVCGTCPVAPTCYAG